VSLALIGALVGLAFAIVEYLIFGALIAKAERRGDRGNGPKVLDAMRKAQLVVFPIIGWFVGPVFADVMGGT